MTSAKEYAAIEISDAGSQVRSASVRPEVARFAIAMEAKLSENDHKGGWAHCPLGYLFKRLEEELTEARDAAQDVTTATWNEEIWSLEDGPDLVELAVQELADVANFAMMIADKLRAGRTR